MLWRRLEKVVPGVESQQFGVNQDEGVQNLLSCSLHTAVELLDQAALQELYAHLTQSGMDQPLHCLRERDETESEPELLHSYVKNSFK